MAACTFTRLATAIPSSGSIVVTVPWALTIGMAGYGVSGVTQNGTATYTFSLAQGVPKTLCDLLDRSSRGANAHAVVT